jgi:hypothetical protein
MCDPPLKYNANASDMQNALTALPTVGLGNLVVSCARRYRWLPARSSSPAHSCRHAPDQRWLHCQPPTVVTRLQYPELDQLQHPLLADAEALGRLLDGHVTVVKEVVVQHDSTSGGQVADGECAGPQHADDAPTLTTADELVLAGATLACRREPGRTLCHCAKQRYRHAATEKIWATFAEGGRRLPRFRIGHGDSRGTDQQPPLQARKHLGRNATATEPPSAHRQSRDRSVNSRSTLWHKLGLHAQ